MSQSDMHAALIRARDKLAQDDPRGNGVRALAALTGLTTQNVYVWFRRQSLLPATYVLKVEAASGVSRHELRGDIYPREA